MKTTSLILVAVILSVIAGILMIISAYGKNMRTAMSVTSYAECAAAGFPILESYPTQCRTPDGRAFVNPEQDVVASAEPALAASSTFAASGCVVGGCSQELCTDASEGPAVSSCVYLPEFSCYRTAVCERQPDGQCGWTQTAELSQCLAQAPKADVQPMSD